MTSPGSSSPHSNFAEGVDVIGRLGAVDDDYYSSPGPSTNESSDSDAPILTRRHHQMRPKRKTPLQTALEKTKKRAASSSSSKQDSIQEKRQKTAQNEATAITMKNRFNTTVKFIVGPEDEEFLVHPFLLEATGLSSLLLAKSPAGPVRLPELDSETFKAFVEWLYSSHMRPEENVSAAVRYGSLIDLYCVGEKMGGGESWMELVVKKMIDLFNQTEREVPSGLTSVIYEKFPNGSRMRRLWVTFNILGETDGQSTNIEFLQDLSQTQRCVIRDHSPDVDYLLDPFKRPERVLGLKKLLTAFHGSRLLENGAATQPTKSSVEKQPEQERLSQREPEPQLTNERSPELGSTPRTSVSSSGEKDPATNARNTYGELMKRFQSTQPRMSAP
ncbi:hypothetical protein MaudCBS49596_003562 [Microsporum audouinii]